MGELLVELLLAPFVTAILRGLKWLGQKIVLFTLFLPTLMLGMVASRPPEVSAAQTIKASYARGQQLLRASYPYLLTALCCLPLGTWVIWLAWQGLDRLIR